MGKDTPPYRLFVRAKDIKLIPAVRSRDREARGEQTYRAANGISIALVRPLAVVV
ncbi:hypothetical protein [Paenibacillus lautus]|uniref:hypothetical protein n=1 Tax=Paenibacillus lautus TaxID=1401 RepID=UPI0015969820|nr:hypothetical protein [Paenibacillus lautus]